MSQITPLFAQLRAQIVLPTLALLATSVPALDGPTARNLSLGTAAQETQGRYLAQYPSGPALGFWQIEPDTYFDLMDNFVAFRPHLEAALASLLMPGLPVVPQLGSNLSYGCAIARLVYYRAPEPLPAATDIQALGQYWKTHYNTAGGAGAVDQFVSNFNTLIGDPPDA